MAHPFPSPEWLAAFSELLNGDEQYGQIAKNWEGDLLFVLERGEGTPEDNNAVFYMDLWHGKCRSSRMLDSEHEPLPDVKFVLSAPLADFVRVLKGELDPVQAMLTRRLRVKGNMAYMLRNIPVVLDFVRCARLVELDLAE